MGQDQAIRTLFVTLRRSQAGKPWFHRKVLDGLGLKKRLTCVEKPNNPVIRGMLRKVAHLVVIETDQMYYNRKLVQHAAAKLRPPVTIKHELPMGGFAAGPALAAAMASASAAPSAATSSRGQPGSISRQQQQQQPHHHQQG